ncbi:MAG: hypothetical protein IJV22_08015 [Bacteroidales bacterium]|nr:hypothetical protein [Bacteroidales bacterium]
MTSRPQREVFNPELQMAWDNHRLDPYQSNENLRRANLDTPRILSAIESLYVHTMSDL